jgi:FixJ family two-component response regulator
MISTELSAEERQLLAWCAEMVPRRMIAEWLGITHEAAKKRVARASQRAKRLTLQLSQRMSDDDRKAVARFLERADRAPRQGAGGES